MSGFLYFVSEKMNVMRETVPPECKLESVLDGASITPFNVTGKGPSGSNGTVFSVASFHGKENQDFGYFPERQTWLPVKDGETTTHWLGWTTDDPPTEIDLRRRELVNGHITELSQDSTWIVPAVHLPLSTLPRVFKMTGAGVELEPLPEYAELQQLAEEFFDWSLGTCNEDGTKKVRKTWGQCFEYVSKVLAINYHLGLWELSALGILTTENHRRVIGASIGFPDKLAQEVASSKKA